MSKIREWGKKQGTWWMCFFSAANWCRYFMLLCQKCSFKTWRLQVQVDIGSEWGFIGERHQSETEEEKVQKRGRKKKGRRNVCFDMSGMRRNRRIALKDFLIISYSLMRFLFQGNQEDTTTVTSYASTTKFSFSSQSLGNKCKSHSQLICVVFLIVPPLFPQIYLTLPSSQS